MNYRRDTGFFQALTQRAIGGKDHFNLVAVIRQAAGKPEQ
jgi:hypothetical protein